MMKYIPRVRRQIAPMISANSADTAIATGHCRKPLVDAVRARMPNA